MELVACVPAHQIFGFQPDAFFSNRAPEANQRATVEFPTDMGEFIEVCCFPQGHTPYQRVCFALLLLCVHPPAFIVRSLKAEMQG